MLLALSPTRRLQEFVSSNTITTPLHHHALSQPISCSTTAGAETNSSPLNLKTGYDPHREAFLPTQRFHDGCAADVTGMPQHNSNASSTEKFYNNPSCNEAGNLYKNMYKSACISFSTAEPKHTKQERDRRASQYTLQQAISAQNSSSQHGQHNRNAIDHVQANASRTSFDGRSHPFNRSGQQNFSAQFFPLTYYCPTSEIEYFSPNSSMGVGDDKALSLGCSRSAHSMYELASGNSKPCFDKQGRNALVPPAFAKATL